MKQYSYEIARTSTGKYVLAVSANGEFAHYQTYKMNGYWERKIRATLYHFSGRGRLDVPKKIDWDKLPLKDFLEAPKQPCGADVPGTRDGGLK